MVTKTIFSDGEATDPIYRNIRSRQNAYTSSAYEKCEKLWEQYERFADPEFLKEIKSNFQSRYWEMYLTVFLINEGYEVKCPKPGPDVGIEIDGLRVWFEATCPTSGQISHPDQILQLTYGGGKAYKVPNEKIILRYLNSISEKYNNQYKKWREKEIVSAADVFIIALNPIKIPHEIGDTVPPRILQAAFKVGAPYVALNPKSGEVIDKGYQFRDAIHKASSSEPIPCGVFQQKSYAGLSALLCSRVDGFNEPKEMGLDFQLVPNPHAKIPLPPHFRLKGAYFVVTKNEAEYCINAISDFDVR